MRCRAQQERKAEQSAQIVTTSRLQRAGQAAVAAALVAVMAPELAHAAKAEEVDVYKKYMSQTGGVSVADFNSSKGKKSAVKPADSKPAPAPLVAEAPAPKPKAEAPAPKAEAPKPKPKPAPAAPKAAASAGAAAEGSNTAVLVAVGAVAALGVGSQALGGLGGKSDDKKKAGGTGRAKSPARKPAPKPKRKPAQTLTNS